MNKTTILLIMIVLVSVVVEADNTFSVKNLKALEKYNNIVLTNEDTINKVKYSLVYDDKNGKWAFSTQNQVGVYKTISDLFDKKKDEINGRIWTLNDDKKFKITAEREGEMTPVDEKTINEPLSVRKLHTTIEPPQSEIDDFEKSDYDDAAEEQQALETAAEAHALLAAKQAHDEVIRLEQEEIALAAATRAGEKAATAVNQQEKENAALNVKVLEAAAKAKEAAVKKYESLEAAHQAVEQAKAKEAISAARKVETITITSEKGTTNYQDLPDNLNFGVVRTMFDDNNKKKYFVDINNKAYDDEGFPIGTFKGRIITIDPTYVEAMREYRAGYGAPTKEPAITDREKKQQQETTEQKINRLTTEKGKNSDAIKIKQTLIDIFSAGIRQTQNKISMLEKTPEQLNTDLTSAIAAKKTYTDQETEINKAILSLNTELASLSLVSVEYTLKKAEIELKKAELDSAKKNINEQKDLATELSGISKLTEEQKKAELTKDKTKLAEQQKILEQRKAELATLQDKNEELDAQIQFTKFADDNIIKESIAVLRGLLKSYEAFAGLGRFGSLFLTGDNWMQWRNDVSQALCDTILLGGKQCWISNVCDQYIDTTPGGNSLIARTPAGEPRGVIHLETEKSLPIEFVNETTNRVQTGFLYKITYTISNPNQKPMKYNLRFNARTKTFNAFEPDKELLEGATDGKTGSAAYYKQSYNDYTQACLVFNPSIQTFDGKSTNEFCVPVSQYSGAATSPYTNLPESEGTCNDGIQNQKETSTDCGGPCEQCKTANKPGEFDGF